MSMKFPNRGVPFIEIENFSKVKRVDNTKGISSFGTGRISGHLITSMVILGALARILPRSICHVANDIRCTVFTIGIPA